MAVSGAGVLPSHTSVAPAADVEFSLSYTQTVVFPMRWTEENKARLRCRVRSWKKTRMGGNKQVVYMEISFKWLIFCHLKYKD